jgi:hypothetical protein
MQVEGAEVLSVVVPSGPGRTVVNGTLVARQVRTGGMRWRVPIDLAGERC